MLLMEIQGTLETKGGDYGWKPPTPHQKVRRSEETPPSQA